MDAETINKVTELRNRVQVLVDEGLPDGDLVSIWPHVRHQWLELFPESTSVLTQAETRGPAFGLLVVLETANQFVIMQERAADLRSQTEMLNGMVKGLFSQFREGDP